MQVLNDILYDIRIVENVFLRYVEVTSFDEDTQAVVLEVAKGVV